MQWTGMALVALLRVGLIAVLLLLVYPQVLLPRRPGWDLSDRVAAGAAVGLFLVVGSAYALSPLHMFEPLGMALVLVALATGATFLRGGVGALVGVLEAPLRLIARLLDRSAKRQTWVPEPEPAPVEVVRAENGVQWKIGLKDAPWPVWVLLGIVLLCGLWTRLYSGLTTPAPAPSDYLTHLQWTEWLTYRGLFPDWVYPKGMNAVLGALRFFSWEEPHSASRMGGPLLNLMGLTGVWYVVRKATGSPAGALLAAAVLAGAPAFLPTDWSRQAYPLPQEFAMGLILPSAFWGWRYLTDGDRLDRTLAAMATLVVAGSHWGVLVYVALAFVGVGVTGMVWAYRSESAPEVVPLRTVLVRTAHLAGWTAMGAALGLLPQALALVAGLPLLPAAKGFALGGAGVAVSEQPYSLGYGFWAVFTVLVLVALAGARRDRRLLLFPAIAGAFALVPLLARLGFRSPALETRMGDYLALITAPALGAAFAAVERIAGARLSAYRSALAALLVTAALWAAYPPRPLAMEPMLSQDLTAGALRLKKTVSPGTYIAVGRGELLPLLQGYGMMANSDTFTAKVPPPPAGAGAQRVFLKSLEAINFKLDEPPDLFIFIEPDGPYLSTVDRAAGNAPTIVAQNDAAARWVAEYTKVHGEPEAWFRTAHLIVYRIPPPAR